MSSTSRRQFLSTFGLVSLYLNLASPRLVFAATNAGFPLSKTERLTLAAFGDVIIPAFENGPAASTAQVPDYIERLLANKLPRFRWFARPTAWLGYYKKLFRRLDEIAQRKNDGKSFANLSEQQRIDVVTEMAQNHAGQVGYQVAGLPSAESIDDAQLFGLVRLHIFHGYFGSPEYGGNKNSKGWESIGYICHFGYSGDQSKCPEHIM